MRWLVRSPLWAKRINTDSKGTFVSDVRFGGVYFVQQGKIVGPSDVKSARSVTTKPRHFIVTGNGRGGTTAAASILNAFGFEAGVTNPYLENLKLRGMLDSGQTSDILAELATWPDRGRRMFWKDSRIWASKFDPLLESLPATVGAIVVFRDPLNIAARNSVLEGFDLIDEIERAAKATRKLAQRLPLLRNRNVALVSYEKLLISPGSVVNALASFAGVTDRKKIDGAVAVIEPSPQSYQDHFKPRAAIREVAV